MAQIIIDSLTFGYEGSADSVFENLSLTLDTDWKLGLIGRNGRGKTTLLRILAGWLPCSDKVQTPFVMEYFPDYPPDINIPVRTLIQTACPLGEEWRLLREMGLLSLKREVLDRSFSDLSGGERTKLMLALLFLHDNAFPLIDEPTNHLDREGRALVGQYLSGKSGFVLASHDRALIDSCVDHILALTKTRAEVFVGNYKTWECQRHTRELFEAKTNIKLEKDIARLEAAAKRTKSWSFAVEKTRYNSENSGLKVDRGYVGHRSAKLMKRAKATEARQLQAVKYKQTLLRDVEKIDALGLAPLKHHNRILVRGEGLRVWYNKTPATPEVSFVVKTGDRLAFTGRNGCGKTSLLRLISGENMQYTGNFQTASGLIVSVVAQDPDQIFGDVCRLAAHFHLDVTRFFTMLRKLGLERAVFDKDMSFFSAGQKKKVLLAKSLCEQAHLYIWDEPLNFIDLDSRKQIEELILEANPTMLFVEHDAVFLNTVASGIIPLD